MLSPSPERRAPFWYLLPIHPYGQRRTLRQTLVEDWVWSFEQVQGIFYVVAPTRMIAVRLETSGLLLYGAAAPTRECLQLLQDLVDQYGPVKYIIQPTLSGLEHKVFAAPLARACPQALIYAAPGQWSFPVNLPLTWLGFPPGRTQILPARPEQAPFFPEFDYQIYGPLDLRLGQFGETALYHRRSRSLLLTDLIVALPETPPPIVELDPYPLLFHARDGALEAIQDSPTQRSKGWQRICLFALYFQASVLKVPDWGLVLREARRVPRRSSQNYFGLYPFQWQTDWRRSFERLRGGGRPFVAPILRELILNRDPQGVLAWADRVSSWDFEQIIPAHFQAPIPAGPEDFRRAFAFLERGLSLEKELLVPDPHPLPEPDLQSLRTIDRWLTRSRLVPGAVTARSKA